MPDFGLSNKGQPGSLLETFCGTLEYAAPEVVSKEKPYEGGPCDVWSLGIILFSMMTGRFPFEEDSVPMILEKMNQGFKAVSFPSSMSPGETSFFLFFLSQTSPLLSLSARGLAFFLM